MNAFESLIADFAKMTGLPLKPDVRGGCFLETDGMFITIQHREEADGGEIAAGPDVVGVDSSSFIRAG